MTEENWHIIIRTKAVTCGQWHETENTDYVTKRGNKLMTMLQLLCKIWWSAKASFLKVSTHVHTRSCSHAQDIDTCAHQIWLSRTRYRHMCTPDLALTHKISTHVHTRSATHVQDIDTCAHQICHSCTPVRKKLTRNIEKSLRFRAGRRPTMCTEGGQSLNPNRKTLI
jgi:hypothetical protein